MARFFIWPILDPKFPLMDALFSGHGGVEEFRRNFPGTREVCGRDPEEIWDDGLQSNDHTYGIKPEAIE